MELHDIEWIYKGRTPIAHAEYPCGDSRIDSTISCVMGDDFFFDVEVKYDNLRIRWEYCDMEDAMSGATLMIHGVESIVSFIKNGTIPWDNRHECAIMHPFVLHSYPSNYFIVFTIPRAGNEAFDTVILKEGTCESVEDGQDKCRQYLESVMKRFLSLDLDYSRDWDVLSVPELLTEK